MFLFVSTLSAEEIKTGWISGKITIKDSDAMSGGMIVLFNVKSGPPPSADKYVRVPDIMGDIDTEGKFHLLIPEGKYYMGAIMRISGDMAGPPLDGDYFIISQDQYGNPVSYTVETGKDLDIGTISGAVPFKRKVAEGVSGISGKIIDISGEPVEGAVVFAYITNTMTGIPIFTSYKTGKDGKYFISMDKGSQYYLRVRDIYGGGPPVPGAIMGGYGEEKPTAVTVITGEVTKDMDIKVIRHLEMGPKGQPETGPDESIMEEQMKKMKQEMEKKK